MLLPDHFKEGDIEPFSSNPKEHGVNPLIEASRIAHRTHLADVAIELLGGWQYFLDFLLTDKVEDPIMKVLSGARQ